MAMKFKSKFKSKQQRLVAIADAYRLKFNRSAVTSFEVGVWAIEKGLWPVPKRGDREAVCLLWEKRLEEACR